MFLFDFILVLFYVLQLLFGVRFPRGPRPATKQSGGAAGSVKSKVGLQRINNIEKKKLGTRSNSARVGMHIPGFPSAGNLNFFELQPFTFAFLIAVM